MKKCLLWGTTLLVLAAVNYLIVEKERILSSGKTVLLHLAPTQHRSLMQGQYMQLRYALADEVPEDPFSYLVSGVAPPRGVRVEAA